MNFVRYFTALMGFLAAILGIARDSRTLVWIAIGFLGSSFAVRLIQRRQRQQDAEEESTETGQD